MPYILTINVGSSSVRYALFSGGEAPRRLLDGKMERLGGEDADTTARRVIAEVGAKSSSAAPDAVGHRVVHGLLHTQPERISASLIRELRRISAFDPEHLPREIEIIEAIG